MNYYNQLSSRRSIGSILCIIKHSDVLAAFGTLIAALIALMAFFLTIYLEYLKPKLMRPKLKPHFNDQGKYPYFRRIGFKKYNLQPILWREEKHYLRRPGFNLRIKICNEGKSTAKNVQARVEKIELYHNRNRIPEIHFYHPTTIKWSGEPQYDPVDIIIKSHFYLDIFYSINEKKEEIIDFNYKDFRELIDKDTREEIVNEIDPTEDVYWNVWVDNSYDRGIRKKFREEGHIIIHIIINAENSDPIRLEVSIKWNRSIWNNPTVKVMHMNNWVLE